MLAHESITGTPQNITVFLDASRDNILKDFRCVACGHIVFQYYGGVNMLVPGETDVEWIEVVGRPKPIQCKTKRREVTMPDGSTEYKTCKTIYYLIG